MLHSHSFHYYQTYIPTQIHTYAHSRISARMYGKLKVCNKKSNFSKWFYTLSNVQPLRKYENSSKQRQTCLLATTHQQQQQLSLTKRTRQHMPDYYYTLMSSGDTRWVVVLLAGHAACVCM